MRLDIKSVQNHFLGRISAGIMIRAPWRIPNFCTLHGFGGNQARRHHSGGVSGSVFSFSSRLPYLSLFQWSSVWLKRSASLGAG